MTDDAHAVSATAIAKGAGSMVLLRVAERIIGFASFAVLARLLRPDDYGLYALALSVSAIVALAGNWGLDSALIQRRGFDRDRYDTAWTSRVLLGMTVAAAIAAAASFVSTLLDEPRIEAVLYVIALSTAIASVENIGTVDFLKTLDYGRELRYRLTIRVLATAIAIAAAFAWQTYWALVAGNIAASVATVVLSYLAHPYRPRFSLAAFGALMRFTRWVFMRNVLLSANEPVANLIVSRFAGIDALAYFTTARQLADVATTDLYAPIRRALFPAYAALSDDRAALKRVTLASTAMMLAVGLPISAGTAVVAPDAVRVLLGERWLDVVPLLQILAIAGCVGSRVSAAPLLFVALDRPDIAAKLAGLRFIVLVVFVSIGVHAAGALGAAWAIVAAAVVASFFNWRLVRAALAMSRAELWRVAFRPAVAAAIMVVVTFAFLASVPDAHTFASSLMRLAGASAIGALAYALALLSSWQVAGRPDGPERHLLDALATLRQRAAAAQ